MLLKAADMLFYKKKLGDLQILSMLSVQFEATN